MTKRIFRSVLAALLAVLLASFALVMAALYSHFASLQRDRLKTDLSLAAAAVEQEGAAYLQSLKNAGCRLTWVAADGTVLFDTSEDAGSMENHGEREEILAALKTGVGESARYSSTLTEETLYRAQRLRDGTVLRASVSYATVPMLALGMLPPVAAVFLLALVLSVILAFRISERIVKPLNSLDLEHPLENNAYDEISPLLTHMEKQRREIRRQSEELESRKREFSAVVKNMKEGLVLLDAGERILSINPAAIRFFRAESGCEGREFLTVERSYEIHKALQEAESKGGGELRVSRDGREYQLRFSGIAGEKGLSGVVLLVLDVTKTVLAEESRREFTANVSHELKTPLQTVLGSAELLENGLVQTEDVPVFAGKIRREAARLVTLIEDIIRLSRLDEGGPMPAEQVELYGLAEEELLSVIPAAQKKGVELRMEGQPVTLLGSRQLFREIVRNLCDNAVKYNVEGGSVTVTVRPCESGGELLVEDTGIGIPPDHQDRVFERFYRVDKSHSRETGGTGLGLSIVKHAVRDLKGRVELSSRPGEGTAVRVVFPRSDGGRAEEQNAGSRL